MIIIICNFLETGGGGGGKFLAWFSVFVAHEKVW